MKMLAKKLFQDETMKRRKMSLRKQTRLDSSLTNRMSAPGSQFLNTDHQPVRSNSSKPLTETETETNMSQTDNINLKVLNENDEIVLFRMKKSAVLGKLMDAWCHTLSLAKSEVIFKFDGEVINEDDTVSSLQLDNDDMIQVVCHKRKPGGENKITTSVDLTADLSPQGTLEPTGTTNVAEYREENDMPPSEQIDMTGSNSDFRCSQVFQKIPDYIHVNVLSPDNAIVRFKIETSCPLLILKKAYCLRVGLTIATVRFAIDGKIINETDTPLSLQMNEEDILEVFLQQNAE